MTTKTLVIGALALGGAYLLFGKSSEAAAAPVGGSAPRRSSNALAAVEGSSASTTSSPTLTRRPVRVLSGLAPELAPTSDPRSPTVKPLSSDDRNRVVSGSVTLGAIGTDGPFRGVY